MIEVLEQLNSIGWYSISLTCISILLFITLGVKLCKDTKISLGLKSMKEIEEEKIKKDLYDLKKEFHAYAEEKEMQYKKYHDQSINIRNDLKEDIKSLTNKFDVFLEMDRKRTIATLRTSLWRMHKEFVEQEYVTPDSLKTFLEMGKIYETAGGNDIYHEKLKPEVEALEIHYPDGSIYHHK